MTDVYVYYFLRKGLAKAVVKSKRRATLEAIKGKGEAMMETQIVVDHTEVDAYGFVFDNLEDECYPMDASLAQIRSLDLRALSRDEEARELRREDESAARYLLRLESQELRKQAKVLRDLRIN